MTTPLPHDLQALCEDVRDFVLTEKEREMKYFVDGINTNGAKLLVVPGNDVTKRGSRCPVCHCKQGKGAKKFWWRNPSFIHGKPCGFESFWFHPCHECLHEIRSKTQATDNVFVVVEDLAVYLMDRSNWNQHRVEAVVTE